MDVALDDWRWYSVRMVVKTPRPERAYHKISAPKCVVCRGGVLGPAGNWLKVGDVDNPGLQNAGPGDPIQEMVVKQMAAGAIAQRDPGLNLTVAGECFQGFGFADVTLAVEGTLEEQAKYLGVAHGGGDLAWCFDHDKARIHWLQRK